MNVTTPFKMIGKIKKLSRLRNSVNGNPQWHVIFISGLTDQRTPTKMSLKTKANSQCGFIVSHTFVGETFEFTLDSSGYETYIIDLKKVN